MDQQQKPDYDVISVGAGLKFNFIQCVQIGGVGHAQEQAIAALK